MVQVVTGIPDLQMAAYEAQVEAATATALQTVMDQVAEQMHRAQVATAAADSMNWLAGSDVRVLWSDCPFGFHPAHDGPCPAGGGVAVLVAADEPAIPDLPGPPAQPYVSPDDLTRISPLWREQVDSQLMPVVAEVYHTSAGSVYAGLVDASGVPNLPPLPPAAAAAYLASAQNSFYQVGNGLWEHARGQMLDGFQAGDSIPEMAERMRLSAGLAAPAATLVARTQVLDASNAGSIATARASGLALRKGWFTTVDLRTRPDHLQAGGTYGAEDGYIPLADQFMVGGESCDRPHDPALSPAQRYNCRCSIGYSVGLGAGRGLPSQRPLPGQPGQPSRPGQPSQPGLPGQPGLPPFGPGLPGVPGLPSGHPMPSRAAPGPGGAGRGVQAAVLIRDALRAAQTRDALATAMRDEARRITGREIVVEVPADAALPTMQEFYEGVLKGMERHPDSRIRGISYFVQADGHYAETAGDGTSILINSWWATPAQRPALLDHVAKDVAEWERALPGWMPRGAGRVDALGLHEYGHAVHLGLPTPRAMSSRALNAATRQAYAAGQRDVPGFIQRQIGAYATSDENELIAGAYVDVVLNGDLASPMSKEIMQALDDASRQAGRRVTTAAEPPTGGIPLPAAPSPAAVESRLPVVIDRSAAPQVVLKQEEAARQSALAAPPVKLKELPARSEAGRALRYYQRQGDDHVNGLLRKGKVGRPEGFRGQLPGAEDVRARIGQIDAALARSELDQPITVYRGLSRPPVPGEPGSTVGKTFTDKGFGSTSASRRAAFEFAPSGFDTETSVMLEIRVPPGVRALGISDEQFAGAAPSVTSEQEILLERGLRYRVISDERIGDVVRNGSRVSVERPYRHVVVEVIPPRPPPIPQAARAVPSPGRARSVTQLRQVAREHGITIPAGLRAPDLQTLAADLERGVAPATARDTAIRAVLAERETVAKALTDAAEMVANGGSARALNALADQIEGRLAVDAAKVARPLLDALRSGDQARIDQALSSVARSAKVKPVGAAQGMTRMDRERMLTVGSTDVPAGGAVRVLRPGYETTFEGRTTLLSRASVTPATPEQARTLAPVKTPVVSSLEAREARLRALAAQEPIEAAELRGNMADSRLLTFSDGTKVVEKRPPAIDAQLRGGRSAERDKRAADAEVLGSRIAEAVGGVRVPLAVEVDDGRILMEYIPEPRPTTAAERATSPRWNDAARKRAEDSAAGRRLGLADYLMSNTDRSLENWWLDSDGRIVAIDHGEAFREKQFFDPGSPFAGNLPNGATSRLRGIDLAAVRRNLEALEPQFVALGRESWYREMMARFDEVANGGSAAPAIPEQAARLAPAKAARGAARAESVEQRQAAVRDVIDAPAATSRPFEQGQQGKTSLVAAPNGEKAVVKTFEFDAARRVDAEELGARVAEAVGLRAPAVVRISDREIGMEFIPGKVAERDAAIPVAIRDSDDGKLLGLADVLMHNSDRAGNWIRLADGHLASIDHASAFGAIGPEMRLRGASSDFASYLSNRGVSRRLHESIDLSRGDLATIRSRIEALRPVFVARGRQDWYDAMLENLAGIDQRANGTRSILGTTPAKAAKKAAASRPESAPQLATRLKNTEGFTNVEVRGNRVFADVRLDRIVTDNPTYAESIIRSGRPTYTAEPATLIAVQGETDRFVLTDGYHRLGEAIREGRDSLPALIDPRVGAYRVEVHPLPIPGKATPAKAATGAKVAVKKVAAPKVPAPKPAPAPAKMTAPALRKELQPVVDAAQGLSTADLALVPRPVLESWLTRLRADPGKVLADAREGRLTQTVVDMRRRAADMFAEADELMANGASAETLAARGLGRLAPIAADSPWPEVAEMRKVQAAMATGDPARIRRALAAAEKKLGLTQIGPDAGKVGTYDRAGMTPIAGARIADAARVEVVRPGYSVEIGGRQVVLSKPVVQEATEESVRAARAAAWTPKDYAARQSEVEDIINAGGMLREVRLGGGAQGRTSIEIDLDGRQVVRKVYPSNSEARASTDAEELSSRVFDALGIRSPAVLRLDQRTLAIEYIDGTLGEDLVTYATSIPQDILDSEDGRLIGLADYLTYGADRNNGNWILLPDGHIAAVDFGSNFGDFADPYFDPRAPYGVWGDFGAYLRGVDTAAGDPTLAASVDISRADLALIRTRLKTLRSEFAARNRLDWYNAMMRQLAEIEKRAVGRTNILAP